MRLDKWLWAARFFKTRALAAEEIGRGRVSVNGQAAKASRELKVGDRIVLRQGAVERTVDLLAPEQRAGPAPVAQALYAETPESIAARRRPPRRAAWAPSRPQPSNRGARPSATAASSPTGSAGARSADDADDGRRLPVGGDMQSPLENTGSGPRYHTVTHSHNHEPHTRDPPVRRHAPTPDTDAADPAADARRCRWKRSSPNCRPGTPRWPMPTCAPRPMPRTRAAAPKKR